MQAAKDIEDVLMRTGARLAPLHQDTSDTALSKYFTIDLSDREVAEDVIASLARLPAVEAAYWKPDEELP